MGSLISGEQFLLELHDNCLPARPIATALLRMQIKTGHQTGHLLVLGYEYTRRLICRQARHGRMADVVIICQRCYCQARLGAWQRAAASDASEREATAREGRAKGRTAEVLYLLPCPGDEYARDVLQGTSWEVW
jgi:hypothetical protein